MGGSDPKGFYKILGVGTNASAAEIKTSYRRKAMEYHPDRCSLPNAKALFQQVEEAYRVLHDPASRSRYDASAVETPDSATSKPEVPEPVHCSVCGVVSAQPRYVIFYRTASFILATRSEPIQGIYCRKCAEKEAIKATLFTWFLGWWGIPFGPIYTVRALVINLFGGKRPSDVNARILAHQAWYFAAIGKFEIAQAVAEQALDFALNHSKRPTGEDARLRASLDAFIATLPTKTSVQKLANVWSRFGRPFIIQTGIMCAAIIGFSIFIVQSSTPTYTGSSYTPSYSTAVTPSGDAEPPDQFVAAKSESDRNKLTPAFKLAPTPTVKVASVSVMGTSNSALPTEVRPPVGSDNILNADEITYCLAQHIRIEAAQKVLNAYVHSDVRRFNSLVKDFNSRCGSYRYEQEVRSAAIASIASYKSKYEREGARWFTKKTAHKIVLGYKPVRIWQGVQHVYVRSRRIAPFRLKTRKGPENYYIKLIDAHTGRLVMTIYVRGGSSYETKVPVGTYKIHYAIGRIWYGIRHRFGPATAYNEGENEVTFSVRGNEVFGHDIELVPQFGGNFPTKSISAAQF